MHKKSIEAAKALKEEDVSCDDGEANNNSESGRRSHHRHPLPASSSADIDASLDHHQLPATGRESVDPSTGGGGTGGGEDALRSESIAALRAKV